MAGGFVDDQAIAAGAGLWRRIHPKWVVRDQNARAYRVSSAAFDNSPDGSPTSVLLADLVAETGRTANDVLKGYEEHALASITAARARECGQGVARDPIPEEPAHGYVFGRKTKANKRCLGQGAVWIIAPPLK